MSLLEKEVKVSIELVEKVCEFNYIIGTIPYCYKCRIMLKKFDFGNIIIMENCIKASCNL